MTGNQWRYEGQHSGFHPNVGCGGCQMALLLILTPDECKTRLVEAEHAGALPRGWMASNAQALLQQLQGYRQ